MLKLFWIGLLFRRTNPDKIREARKLTGEHRKCKKMAQKEAHKKQKR